MWAAAHSTPGQTGQRRGRASTKPSGPRPTLGGAATRNTHQVGRGPPPPSGTATAVEDQPPAGTSGARQQPTKHAGSSRQKADRGEGAHGPIQPALVESISRRWAAAHLPPREEGRARGGTPDHSAESPATPGETRRAEIAARRHRTHRVGRGPPPPSGTATAAHAQPGRSPRCTATNTTKRAAAHPARRRPKLHQRRPDEPTSARNPTSPRGTTAP